MRVFYVHEIQTYSVENVQVMKQHLDLHETLKVFSETQT